MSSPADGDKDKQNKSPPFPQEAPSLAGEDFRFVFSAGQKLPVEVTRALKDRLAEQQEMMRSQERERNAGAQPQRSKKLQTGEKLVPRPPWQRHHCTRRHVQGLHALPCVWLLCVLRHV